jgi:hypothetical protein
MPDVRSCESVIFSKAAPQSAAIIDQVMDSVSKEYATANFRGKCLKNNS